MIKRHYRAPEPLDTGSRADLPRNPPPEQFPTSTKFQAHKPGWVTKDLKVGQAFRDPGRSRFCVLLGDLAEPFVVAEIEAKQ